MDYRLFVKIFDTFIKQMKIIKIRIVFLHKKFLIFFNQFNL